MMQGRKQEVIDRLHAEACSCVILNGVREEVFRQKGVRDLFEILKTDPGLLDGAFIADKVVGKGAAALMIAGGVAGLYTDLISDPALELLTGSGVQVEYGGRAPNIINRTRTGICPVEALCMDCRTAQECLPLIEEFIAKQNKI